MCLRTSIARRLLAVPLLALLSGCANDLTDALIEQPLGKLSELAVNLQFRKERDPLLFGYTYLLGEEHHKLVRRKNVPYRFHVIELEEPNAFAIPWGGIYVTKGLLRFADTEDQISFVMGHEVGHVERRHSSLAFQRNLLINLGLQLLTSNNTENWMQFAYLGNNLLDLHFSRENEHAADRQGVMYAVNSGHDPVGGVEFFQKLDQRYGATPRFWSYFQTHPINRDRINTMRGQPGMQADPIPLTMIAEGYRQRGLLRAAAARYQEAIEADENHGPAYLGLARLAAARGEVQVARRLYDEAVAHGVDAAAIEVERQTLPATAPPQPDLVLASASEVQAVSTALRGADNQVAQVERLGAAVWSAPLSSSPALVNMHDRAGTLLNRLYERRDQMAKPLRELVSHAQRLRATAMRAATDIGAAQEEAELATAMLAQNRERLLRKLEQAPTAAAVATARAALLDHDRAIQELRDGVQRLNETVPPISRSVEQAYDAIAMFHDTLLTTGRSGAFLRAAIDTLTGAEARIDEAIETAARSRDSVYLGRVRALESSIDITLVDRPAYQRAAAQRIMARFLLAQPEQVNEVLLSGFSYGEAAYLLGMARSGSAEPQQLIDLTRDAGQRATVDRLSRRETGRTDNVAIILKLINHTLLDELEPAAPPAPEQLPATQPVNPA